MIKFTDILIELPLLLISLFISLVLFAGNTEWFALGVLPWVSFLFIHYYRKRRRKIARYLEEDFKKLGYKVISERPVQFFEFDASATLTFSPIVTIGGIPLSRFGYKRKFLRVFEVETVTGKRHSLYTLVTKHWSEEIELEILEKKET